MSRIGKVVVFGAAWMALFAITAGIAATRDTVDATVRVPPKSSELDRLFELHLKTDALGFDELELTDPGAYAALDEEIVASKEIVRRCKELVLAGSASVQEWFEVSFEVRAGPGQLFHLQDIVLERGTAELTPDAEQCIISAFGEMQLHLDAPPRVRIRYPFCFNRKPNAAVENATQE